MEVSEAVDSLAARTVLPATDETLTRRLLTAHRAAQQLLGVVLALVHQIDASGVAGRAGAPTTTAWLRQRLHLTAAGARRLTVLAAAADAFPVAREALAAGLVGVDQLQAITTALSRLPADAGPAVVDKAAHALVGHARELPADDLSRLGQRILWHVAPDVAERADHEALRREEASADRDRFFTITPDGPAAVRVHGRFDREAAAIIRAALDPLCNPRTAPRVLDPRATHAHLPPAATHDGAARFAGGTLHSADGPPRACPGGGPGPLRSARARDRTRPIAGAAHHVHDSDARRIGGTLAPSVRPATTHAGHALEPHRGGPTPATPPSPTAAHVPPTTNRHHQPDHGRRGPPHGTAPHARTARRPRHHRPTTGQTARPATRRQHAPPRPRRAATTSQTRRRGPPHGQHAPRPRRTAAGGGRRVALMGARPGSVGRMRSSRCAGWSSMPAVCPTTAATGRRSWSPCRSIRCATRSASASSTTATGSAPPRPDG